MIQDEWSHSPELCNDKFNNKMNKLTFKTNIKCVGCVARVTTPLDETAGINQWSVDLENPDKLLTVMTEELDAGQIIEAVNNSGYNAEVYAVQATV
ncbi:MAG: heavy-metal-associated domain-containing protein [Bacteroidia bacterium]|jgi:copper chaperone CopZ